MSQTKALLSPIQKVKAALIKSPKPSISLPLEIKTIETEATSAAEVENTDQDTHASADANGNADIKTTAKPRIEEIYFHKPQSRECLSVNPGDHQRHAAERSKCTAENWKAEIERRLVAGSQMVDHAYAEGEPFRRQAYGHGDGRM